MDWWRVFRLVLGGALPLLGIAGSLVVLDLDANVGNGLDVLPAFGGERIAPEEPLTAEEVTALEIRARSVALRVQAATCDGNVAGTATVVDGRLITNAHLVQGADAMLVSSAASPGSRLLAEVDRRSNSLDLASGPSRSDIEGALGVHSGELADEDPVVGESVFMAGWTAAGIETIEARVHLYVDGDAYGGTGTAMLLDPATTFGFSGGPVLDREGRVVAILRSVDLTTSLTVAIPVSEVDHWLDDPNDADHSSSC